MVMVASRDKVSATMVAGSRRHSANSTADFARQSARIAFCHCRRHVEVSDSNAVGAAARSARRRSRGGNEFAAASSAGSITPGWDGARAAANSVVVASSTIQRHPLDI